MCPTDATIIYLFLVVFTWLLFNGTANEVEYILTSAVITAVYLVNKIKLVITLDVDAACADGRWGVNCSERCRCANQSDCDHVTGTCSCSPGWTGQNCDTRKYRSLLQTVLT